PAQHAEHPLFGAAGAADRCAHVDRVQQAQLVVVLVDDVGDLEQQRLALIGLELAPWTLESGARSGNGPVDILLVAFGYGREQIAGGRVTALEGFAGGGSDPLAVYQHAFDIATSDKGMPGSFDCLRHSHGFAPRYIQTNIATEAAPLKRQRHVIP